MKQTSWTLYRVVVVGVESVEERRVQCGRLPEATPPSLGNCRPANTVRLGVLMPNVPTDARAYYVILVHLLIALKFTTVYFLQHLHLASCLHLTALSSLKHTTTDNINSTPQDLSVKVAAMSCGNRMVGGSDVFGT